MKRSNKDNRESASKRGYGTNWRRFRKMYLTANPLCKFCGDVGRLTPSTLVHHMDEDPANNDDTNLLALCRDCHEQLHGRMAGGVKYGEDGYPVKNLTKKGD